MIVGVITGNVGADPETKKSAKGEDFTTFNVAVNRAGGDKNETQWIRVVCFKQNSTFASNFIRKGSSVTMYGDISVEAFTDKQGNARASLKIIPHPFGLEARGKAEASQSAGGGATSASSSVASEDVPF